MKISKYAENDFQYFQLGTEITKCLETEINYSL